MNTVASLPAKLTKIAASMDRMGKLGIPVKAECVQRWADEIAALATPEQPGSAVQGEAEDYLVEADAWEAASFIFGSDADGFCDSVVFVGEYTKDDGSIGYGLLIRSADYPEEGVVPLREFPKPVTAPPLAWVPGNRIDGFKARRHALDVHREQTPHFDTPIYLHPPTPLPAPAAEQGEVARLRHVIERDRTVFCGLIVRCKNVLAGRKWLGDEHARAAGGYAYDEPGFIREFGQAWTEIMGELERMHRVFQDFSDCPRGEALRAAQADAERVLAPQPEARGVEGLLSAMQEIQMAANGDYEVGGLQSLLPWLADVSGKALAPFATPNPVRAEQPEGKGADRMAIRLLVAAGHVTEAKANEALCIAHGFEPGPLAPAAPVGVDEATQKAIDNAHENYMRGNIDATARDYLIDKAKRAALAGKDGA